MDFSNYEIQKNELRKNLDRLFKEPKDFWEKDKKNFLLTIFYFVAGIGILIGFFYLLYYIWTSFTPAGFADISNVYNITLLYNQAEQETNKDVIVEWNLLKNDLQKNTNIQFNELSINTENPTQDEADLLMKYDLKPNDLPCVLINGKKYVGLLKKWNIKLFMQLYKI